MKILKTKRFIMLAVPMLLAVVLLVTVVYADSSDQRMAGPYLVTEPAVLDNDGQPIMVDGELVISGTVSNVIAKGTIEGSFFIDFTCVLGAGTGGARQCEGVQTIIGFLAGIEGTFQHALEWEAGGTADFTHGTFKLIEGSGTDGLVGLQKSEGIFQRDSAAGPDGIYVGVFSIGGADDDDDDGEDDSSDDDDDDSGDDDE